MPRALIAAAALIATAITLAGCSFLAPTRDTDGGIIGEVTMPSIEAWVGDCFTFVDGSNLAYASVVPCAEPHTHLVIGTGTLNDRRIARFESLQVAVLEVCADRVDIYGSAHDGEVSAEYIVSKKKDRDGREVTHYSCLVKDSSS